MSLGVIGKKVGMTRVFNEDGSAVPVTIIDVGVNYVTQIKTAQQDGYYAVQVSSGKRRVKLVNKALRGHFAKASVEPGEILHEFRFKDSHSLDSIKDFNLGDEYSVELFEENQLVDVSGVTKGKGFAGTVKRYGFRMQDASHGNSLSHRVPGSIGQNQTPGKVFKGKKMAGRMGNVQRTVQNLKVIQIDKDKRFLAIKGAVPGAPGNYVVVESAVKAKSVGKQQNQDKKA